MLYLLLRKKRGKGTYLTPEFVIRGLIESWRRVEELARTQAGVTSNEGGTLAVDRPNHPRLIAALLLAAIGGYFAGRAFGGPVTGQWRWENGYFCRDLFWNDTDLGYNCQLVQENGPTLRFTSDQGAGMFADLTLE